LQTAIAGHVQKMGGVGVIAYFPDTYTAGMMSVGFPAMNFPILNVNASTGSFILSALAANEILNATFNVPDASLLSTWLSKRTTDAALYLIQQIIAFVSYLTFSIWCGYVWSILAKARLFSNPPFIGLSVVFVTTIFRLFTQMLVPTSGNYGFSDIGTVQVIPYQLSIGLEGICILFMLIIWLQIMSARKTLPKQASQVFKSVKWFIGYCVLAAILIILSIVMPLYAGACKLMLLFFFFVSASPIFSLISY
jgi:hypothetical protein